MSSLISVNFFSKIEEKGFCFVDFHRLGGLSWCFGWSCVPAVNARLREEKSCRLVAVDVRFEEMVHENDSIEAVTVCLRQLVDADLVVHVMSNQYGQFQSISIAASIPERLEFGRFGWHINHRGWAQMCQYLQETTTFVIANARTDAAQLLDFQRQAKNVVKIVQYDDDQDFTASATPP